MNEYPGTKICHGNFCSLLAKAWLKGVTAQIPQEAYQPNTLYVIDNSSAQTDHAVLASETATATTTVSDTCMQENVSVQHDGQKVGCNNEAAQDDDSDTKQSNTYM